MKFNMSFLCLGIAFFFYSCTLSLASTYEIQAEGRTIEAAQTHCRIKACRENILSFISRADAKKYAVDIRKNILLHLKDLTTLEVIKTSQIGSDVTVRAKVTVDDAKVRAGLMQIKELASVLEQNTHKEHVATNLKPTQGQQNSATVITDEQFLALLFNLSPAEEILAALNKGANAKAVVKNDTVAENNWPALLVYVQKAKSDLNLKVLEAFVQHGADVNVQINAEKNPLVDLILATKNQEFVQWLLHAKLNVHALAKEQQLALVSCVLGFNTALESTFKQLLEAGLDTNLVNNDALHTPLLSALLTLDQLAPKVRLACLQMLLQKGANPNSTNALGETALHTAIVFRAIHEIKLLLQFKADPNLISAGEAPLYAALQNNVDSEIVLDLLASQANPNLELPKNATLTPLMLAVHFHRADLVDALIKAKAEVDAENVLGRTALMYAARDGQVEIVKKLLAKGADLNHVDKQGYQVLAFAIAGENVEVVKLLVHAGVNLNTEMRALDKKMSVHDYINKYASTDIKTYLLSVLK